MSYDSSELSALNRIREWRKELQESIQDTEKAIRVVNERLNQNETYLRQHHASIQSAMLLIELLDVAEANHLEDFPALRQAQ